MKSSCFHCLLALLVWLGLHGKVYAQIGIGTTTPVPEAALEVVGHDKGVLLPKVSLTDASILFDGIAATPRHIGMLVYNTNTATNTGLRGVGYYYWSGTTGSTTGFWTKVGGDVEGSTLVDNDGDTKIQVEESPDDDSIRFDIAGTERFVMTQNATTPRIEVLSTNTAVGSGTLQNNTTGAENTANGYRSLFSNTTGTRNTANGAYALNANITGSNNTAHGNRSLFSNTTGDYNIASGYQSLYLNTTGAENTAFGSFVLYSNTTGDQNTANGYRSLFSNTEGVRNTANGAYALSNTTTGSYNTANGNRSLFSNTTGVYNTASGYQSLYSNTTGPNNTAFGSFVLYSNTTGSNNTSFGYRSLFLNTTGSNNSANGYAALYFNTTGERNIANGNASLYSNTTGNNNTAIGLRSLYSNTTGSQNAAYGYQAGGYTNAGTANATSTRSLYLGYDTRALADGGTNEIVIGHTARGAGSNTVVLGNDAITETHLKGNIILGPLTSSSPAKLHIEDTHSLGTTSTLITTQFDGNNGLDLVQNYVGAGDIKYEFKQRNAANTYDVLAFSEGKVGIGTTTPTQELDVNGNIAVNGITVLISDKRLKKDIIDLDASLAKLLQLRGVQYHWKDPQKSKELQIGVIAQEVEAIFPELVNNDGAYKSVNYAGFTPILIEAVKELKAENDRLKSMLADVLARLEALEE